MLAGTASAFLMTAQCGTRFGMAAVNPVHSYQPAPDNAVVHGWASPPVTTDALGAPAVEVWISTVTSAPIKLPLVADKKALNSLSVASWSRMNENATQFVVPLMAVVDADGPADGTNPMACGTIFWQVAIHHHFRTSVFKASFSSSSLILASFIPAASS